jgi:hypothetical protein
MTTTVIPPTDWASGRTVALVDVRPHPVGRFRVAPEPTCTCGQALDCAHAAHCPRCGITLRG